MVYQLIAAAILIIAGVCAHDRDAWNVAIQVALKLIQQLSIMPRRRDDEDGSTKIHSPACPAFKRPVNGIVMIIISVAREQDSRADEPQP